MTPPSVPPPLIDIGVNLAHRSFDPDRDAVLARARTAGVEALVVTGTSEAASAQAAALAASRPGLLWATAGVHPHHARDFTAATPTALAALLARPEVVAVGECGLDFNRSFSPHPDQERAFEAQLELAAAVNKPLFLHERDAADRFTALLARHRPRLGAAVVHCFTGDAVTLGRYLDLDLHIGVTGWICDVRRGAGLRALVRQVPLDRLMLETDAPFLFPHNAPRPGGGGARTRNEPGLLPYVLAAVAAAVGLPAAEVARRTTATARAFFGLPAPA